MLYRIDCWNDDAKNVAAMLRRNYFNDAVAIDDRFVEVSGSKLSGRAIGSLIQLRLDGDPRDYIVETIG